MRANRRRTLRAYYTFRLVAPFVYAMWLTVAMLYFATVISSDPFRLAMLGVALELSSFLFEIPTGIVADVFSRKWSIVIGYLIWGGGYLLQGLFPVYELVLASQVIWGLGFCFVSGAPEAWLVDELAEAQRLDSGLPESAALEQDEVLSVFLRGSQVGQAATLCGIVAAVLLGSLNVALPIVAGGLGTLLLAVLLALVMPERGFRPVQRAEGKSLRAAVRHSVGLVRGGGVLRAVIWIGIIIGTSVGGFDALYTPHFVQNFEMPLFEPVVWFGILFGAVTLLCIPTLELVQRVLKRRPQLPIPQVLALFALGTVAGNLVFVWAGGFYLALAAYCGSQILRTATKPLFIAWMNRYIPSAVRATVISMYWQSNALGQILGAPVWGALGSLVSLRAALSLASAALLPVIVIYRRERDAEEKAAFSDADFRQKG